MTIQQLKFFCEACNSKSIAAAASKLFITPSGLSMALQRLEKELSCKLLIRTSRGVKPTCEGEFLWNHAREIVSHMDACEEFFSTQANQGSISVLALAANIPDEMIGELALEFNGMSDKRSIILNEYPSPICDVAVENGVAELGFNTPPFDEDKFELTKIVSYPLYLLVNSSHMYAALDAIPTAYLDKMNLVVRESKEPYRSEFFTRCRQMGAEPYIAHETSNTLMVYNMVKRDSQVFGIVPESAAKMISIPEVKVIPFEDKGFARTVYMFKNRGVTLSKTAREWEKFVIDHVIKSETPEKAQCRKETSAKA